LAVNHLSLIAIVEPMCGRYVTPDKEAVLLRWPKIRCDVQTTWQPGTNVAPTRTVPILIQAPDGGLAVQAARWGFIPPWWSKPKPPGLTFNARVEEAATKPMWCDGFRGQRCLLPARGWYEWNNAERILDPAGRDTGQPYFIYQPAEPIMVIAGLWSVRADTGQPSYTSAMLTRAAVPDIAFIHPRMPVVLPMESIAEWLDPATPATRVNEILAMPGAGFAAHPVSPRVNQVRNEGADLMQKVQTPPASLFGPDD